MNFWWFRKGVALFGRCFSKLKNWGIAMMKSGRGAIAIFVLLVGLAGVSSRVQAQATGTSLNGTVTDTSGGIVAGASLKLIDTRTNNSYSAQTTSTGGYRFVDVAPG